MDINYGVDVMNFLGLVVVAGSSWLGGGDVEAVVQRGVGLFEQ